MKPNLAKRWAVLGRLPVGILYPLVILLAGGIGWLEYLSNFELSFSFLYLIPLTLITWQRGWKAGLFIAGFCTLIGLAAGNLSLFRIILYWEALNRLIIFCFMIVLLSRFRNTLAHERILAQTDTLTGLMNRRAFYNVLSQEKARMARYGHPATLVYVDLDAFKEVNDLHGHPVGDYLLEVVAQTLLRQVRDIDKVARLGGDEFAVLLPETDEEAAQTIIPRLRFRLLAAMEEHGWPITFSFGVLTCYQADLEVSVLIQVADGLMYSVKRENKNDIAYKVI
ncbi:MAG: GGDEF domain-containing protein [Anaerolineales bacterium]|nr:GGDEF domain-containing protein [Anaerolineales bacterium]